ncbi:MAG: hypothetical protein K5696_01715 [Lachnospiraceae bacterium]|nr:hypothetical protein [Lachnospiraceae bacterium]
MENVLLVGFGSKYSFTANRFRLIKERLGIRNSYLVSPHPEDRELLAGEMRAVLRYAKVFAGDYGDYVIDEDPLQDGILDASAKYAMETVYMMQRHGWRYDSFTRCKNLYFRHLKYWDSFLRKKSIDYVFFHSVPHEIFDFVIYQLCKVHGIPMCFGDNLHEYREGETVKRYYTTDYYYSEPTWLDDVYREVKEACADGGEVSLPEDQERLFQGFLKNAKNPATSVNRKGWAGLMEEIRRYYTSSRLRWTNPLRQGYALYQTKQLQKHYNQYAVYPDYSDRYIYVPLHYFPECTTFPQGGGLYGDQILMIDILAHAAGEGTYIYVKEHPTQIIFGRKKEFYDSLAAIPNVKLIRTDTVQYEIIAHSMAVSTLTGTTGYECQYMGKPFLMFGYYITRYAPGTLFVRNVEDCKKALEEIRKGEQGRFTERDIRIYLKFVEGVAIRERTCTDEVFTDYIDRVTEKNRVKPEKESQAHGI